MYAIVKQITSCLFGTVALLCLQVASTSLAHAQEDSPNLSESIGAALDETSEAAQASEEAQTEERIPELSQKEHAFNQALAESSPEDQVEWLDIKYPGAASTIQSLALKIGSKAATTHGAALIIPDTSQHADWPNQVRNLREELPYGGWVTLSISLPWPDLDRAPERELEAKSLSEYTASEAITRATAAGSRSYNYSSNDDATTEASEESQNDESAVDINLKENDTQEANTMPYQERALIHVQAAMDHLAQQGFQNIALIAIGQSAELAVEYVQSRETEIKNKGFALILLEPKLPYQFNSNFSTALGNGFPAPVLDIYRSSSRVQSEDADERKASARAGKFQAYQQLNLSAPLGAGTDNFLNKRIKDWLSRYAPGEEQK